MPREAGDRKGWDPIFWPCLLGGASAPFIGGVLERWLPRAIAGGIGFFLAWIIVGVAFSMSPPTSKWSLMRWTIGGAVGALVGGVSGIPASGMTLRSGCRLRGWSG